MIRIAAAATLALFPGVGLAYWAADLPTVGASRLAAVGLAELAVFAAVVDAGRRAGGFTLGGFNRRPPAI